MYILLYPATHFTVSLTLRANKKRVPMGLQRKIEVPVDLEWSVFAARLAPLQPVVRMIDGLPAYPEEQPEPGWQEVRITLPGGMVTLKKEPGHWLCTIWGDTDDELKRSWEACCNAIASG